VRRLELGFGRILQRASDHDQSDHREQQEPDIGGDLPQYSAGASAQRLTDDLHRDLGACERETQSDRPVSCDRGYAHAYRDRQNVQPNCDCESLGPSTIPRTYVGDYDHQQPAQQVDGLVYPNRPGREKAGKLNKVDLA